MSPHVPQGPRRTVRTLALAAAIGSLAVPAAAQTDPCIDPVTGQLALTEEQVYIHQADTKVGNLAGVDLARFPSWDRNRPTQSVRSGGGGSYLAPIGHFFLEREEDVTGLTIKGTQTGCLDTMLVELYAFLPTNRTHSDGDLQERPFLGWFTLDVNGEPIHSLSEHETKTTLNPNNDGTYRIRVALTGLYDAFRATGVAPDGDHVIRLSINARYQTNNALFLYDAIEVPAGITFNGRPNETYSVLRPA